MRILFMGTPDFARESLEKLYNSNHEIISIVTNPDRPKGRGMKMTRKSCKGICNIQKYKYISTTKSKR